MTNQGRISRILVVSLAMVLAGGALRASAESGDPGSQAASRPIEPPKVKAGECGVMRGKVLLKGKAFLDLLPTDAPAQRFVLGVDSKVAADKGLDAVLLKVKAGHTVQVEWAGNAFGQKQVVRIAPSRAQSQPASDVAPEAPAAKPANNGVVTVDSQITTRDYGTVVGTIVEKGDDWIRVKPFNEQESVKFVPRWTGGMPEQGGGYDKKVLAAIGAVRVGDNVALRWTFDGRKRVIELTTVDGDN